MDDTKRWLAAGAALAGLGVAAGAFGAHALEARLPPELLEVYATAVRYHLLHAVALMVVGLAGERAGRPGMWNAAGWLFLAGVLAFAGSLYALAFGGAGWLGAVAPIGGVCFLAGWIVVVVAALTDGADPQSRGGVTPR